MVSSNVDYRLDGPDYAVLMVQIGYCTFRDGGDLPLRLDFPNREVRETYVQDLLAICHANFNTPSLRQLHGALAKGNETQRLEALHACFQPMAHHNLLTGASYRAVLQSLLIMVETNQRGEDSSWGAMRTWLFNWPHACGRTRVCNRGQAEP